MGKGHAVPNTIFVRLLVVSNPCGVAYFSTSTWFHRPSSVRKAVLPLHSGPRTEDHWCIGILAPFLCSFHQFILDLFTGERSFVVQDCIPSLEPKTAQSPNLNFRDLWGLRLVKIPSHLHSGWAHGFVLAQNHRLVWGQRGQSFRPPLLGSVGQSVNNDLPHFQFV